jgi:uncharacterized protein (TIGR03437 family)
VTIGDQNDVPILYAGAALGSVEGVIQVNAMIPSTVAAGSQVPVFLQAVSAARRPFTLRFDRADSGAE